jgi:SAM-dependent methyltransferase
LCGLGITLEPPNDAVLARLYEQAYDSGAERDESGVPRTDLLGRLWHRVNGSMPLSDLPLRTPVLDVGSNRGDLLLALRERGIHGVGLEPNPVAAEFARKRGLEIVGEPIERAELPPSHFGSIVLSHVLEHMRDPHAALRRLRPALRPEGILHVAVPNARSFWRRVFGVDWVHWHVPFHLYHYTQRSLGLLLEQTGFQPMRMRTITPGEWLLLSFEARRNARRGTYRLEHFAGRYVVRLALSPPARVADAAHRGDAIVAEAVRV